MRGDRLKQLKIAKAGYILISIVFYVSGILCLFLPNVVTKYTTTAGGIILIIYGIIKMIGFFSKDLYCLAFQYDFACGLLLMVLGTLVLCMNTRFKGHLLTGLGILILLDSLLSIQTAIEAKRFGLSSWPVILAASLFAGTLGVILIVLNSQIAAGCALLAEGFLRQYIVQCTVRLSPCKQVSDEISHS